MTTARFKKLGFDLSGNALQPIFGAHGPVLTMAQLRLQCLDLIFGGSKLQGKVVCDTQRVVAVLFRGGCRLLKQSQNGLSGFVYRIVVVGKRLRRNRCEWDNPLWHIGGARTHRDVLHNEIGE